MNLQIRDPRARELARQLAQEKRMSMTEAVINALESELQRAREKIPLEDQLAAIAADLKAKSKGTGHRMTKDEIDEMWGD